MPRLRGHGLIGRPGEYMSYCNDGYGLLSEIVRRVGGEASFADYVKKNILDPLEMERSGCDYLRPRLDENSAVLYKKENGVMTGCKDYYDNAFVLGGAGSMKSTISDMKKILYMYLNHGKTPDGGRILSMEGIRSMCRPRMEYRPESWYCYGLATKKIDDVTVVEHGGSLTGVSSNMSWSYDAGLRSHRSLQHLRRTGECHCRWRPCVCTMAGIRWRTGGFTRRIHGQKRPEGLQWAATFPVKTPRWRSGRMETEFWQW